ncbi:MAG TPA: hypothetical protein VF764_05825 [Steroidobacteraceae bacterium]
MDYQHNLGPFWLIGAIVVIIPFWRICQRVGYSPWLSLLMALPLVNLIFIYVLAFSNWPSQKGTVVSGGT